MIEIILWVTSGALAGWITFLFTGLENGHRGLNQVAVGALGALIGGAIVRATEGKDVSGINLSGMLMAAFASIIMLFAYTSITGHGRL